MTRVVMLKLFITSSTSVNNEVYYYNHSDTLVFMLYIGTA